MCDINSDNVNVETEMVYKTKILPGSLCMKCKTQKPTAIVRVNDSLCRSCLLTYTTHKFRSTLGKSKLVKANDRVLLVASGSQSSTALLHLVKEALGEGAHKRLRFSPGVVFIDESVTLQSKTECELGIQDIKKLVDDMGYPFHCVPIYQNFHSADTDADGVNEINKSSFSQAFAQLSTLTATVHFLSVIRMSVIVATARKHCYTKVMIGDTASDLSVTLLCNILQGNGNAIPFEIGVADKRYSDIVIIRPLREFSSKEVALYNRLNHLRFTVVPNILTKKASNSCIQRQTEQFVNSLQAGFPSTVNTIFRTGDKLCLDQEFTFSPCLLCQRPKDRIEELDTGLNCKKIETEVEQDKRNDVIEQQHKEMEVKEKMESLSGEEENLQIDRLSLSDVKSKLCYGCNITLKEMGEKYELLPQFILKTIQQMKNRARMKNEIKDFLL
ncbi:cytoplasmic tRNA 2-thiolation protein 2 isoform X3 [Hydra vulgaris]|uniref:Cytoplasmic tRNA 2-thiolation protein 2 n=1 Tax=Hydra vulgaris TaxID=6087 RepID=A0ABM4CDR1_HYDVU